MLSPPRLRPALTGLAALILGLALGCGPAENRVQVIYYYQVGSEASARQLPALRALENEFSGSVVVKTIDATSPEAKKDLTRLGWASHGLVVRDHRGIMLFKQSGDDFAIEEIRSTLRQATGAA
jgi:hypothetical protein